MPLTPPFNHVEKKSLSIHQITRNVNDVFRLYEEYGDKDYIGENMTQLQHAIQTGSMAIENGDDNEIVLGCFLHDIGHLVGLKNKSDKMGNLGVHKHEIIGAEYLEKLHFPKTICDIVRNHVDAKRYLITTNEDYIKSLSSASQKTLAYQNGIMSDKELEEFNKDPLKDVYIKIRKWEDESKSINVGDVSTDTFRKMCYKLLLKPIQIKNRE